MRRVLVGLVLALAVLAAAVLVPDYAAVAQSHSEVTMSKKPKPLPTVRPVPIPTKQSNPATGNGGVTGKHTPPGEDVNLGRDFLDTRSPMRTWTPSQKKRGTGADLPPANLPQQFNQFTPREQRYYQQLRGDGSPQGQQRLQDFLNQYWFQNT
jgi:hypothetical protein